MTRDAPLRSSKRTRDARRRHQAVVRNNTPLQSPDSVDYNGSDTGVATYPGPHAKRGLKERKELLLDFREDEDGDLVNAVVSRDRIVDDLWGDRPPASASKLVQVYSSRLRKVIGPEILVTQQPGYVLRVLPEQIDLHGFVRSCGRVVTRYRAEGR